MVLKIFGFIGLNFLLSFLIIGILFISLFIRMALTTRSSRRILNIFLTFSDIFIIVIWFKWFGIWASILPIIMFIFSFFCFVFYKEDDEDGYDKSKSYYDN